MPVAETKVAAAIAATSGAATTGALINNISTPMFGAPLTVIGMAALGVFVSFAWAKPEMSRPKLFAMSIGNTFVATLAVVLIPAWLGWSWVKPELQAPLAGGIGLAARFVVPVLIEQGPEVVKSWINRFKAQTPGEKK